MADDCNSLEATSGDDVKYRVIHYETWGSLFATLLTFFIPPLRFVWPEQLISRSHPDIRNAERDYKYRPRVNFLEITSHNILVILLAVKLPFALAGAALEWLLNFYLANNGYVGLLGKLITLDFTGIVFRPKQSDPFEYYSVIRWMDPRMDLIDPYSPSLRRDPNTGNLHYDSRNFADLCIMAAKLAYESQYIQESVVNKRWKMHFRQFYDFPNAHEKPVGLTQRFVRGIVALVGNYVRGIPWLERVLKSVDQWIALRPRTKAFTFTNKATEADLIVLAFRGTEPFDADDWATDFDFSFIDLDDGIGRLHLGFLEALGVVDRDDVEGSSVRLKQNLFDRKEDLTTGLSQPKLQSMAAVSATRINDKQPAKSKSRKCELASQASLFERLSTDLIQLLKENPNARVVVTGHSLGAALAAVFGALVLFTKTDNRDKKLLVERLTAIYPFAQPRVGDEVFASSMNSKMEEHNVQYYRVVYAYDLVPRIPFEDSFFGFKHFGFCCYNTIMHQQKALIEEPDKNFISGIFSVLMRIGSAQELVNGMLMNRVRYGDDFQETILMTIARFISFIIPGLVAHTPTNYVNAIRLGPSHLKIVPFDDE